ncbi:MAG: hypothetical protein P9M00_02360 [Candidatus Tritonobacter lacicola]|nr:hypothetical protein [Candidatus Tritonobacter lacicola]
MAALLLVLTSLFILGYGTYWTNPAAFMTKLRLLMSLAGSETGPSERGLICGFETQKDILNWKSSGCMLSLSADYFKSGISGGRLLFDGAAGSTRTKLEDYVFGPGSVKDWSSFERLTLWLSNGGTGELDIELQVKDSGERRYHHALHLEPGAEERVFIELERLAGTVDLMRIVSVIIRVYGTSSESELFIDEIKLEGKGDPLGKPFITFSRLEVPAVAYRGKSFTFNGYLRAEKHVPDDYRVFLHIYPEDQAPVAETSGRAGLINADHDPPMRTSLWPVGADESVGPLEIYIPEYNPPGTYIIEMGLFNPGSPGMGERGVDYPGAYDYSGSFPKYRYTNPGIGGYVVGRFQVF